MPSKPLATSTVGIRPAIEADLPQIEFLLESNALPLDGVRAALSGFVVAIAADAIVGVAGVEDCGRYGLLRSTAVSADMRGLGIASRLVNDVVASATAHGLASLYLLTTTAENYFPKHGFRIVSRDAVPREIRATAEYCGACPASATAMFLPLCPGAD